MNRPKSAASADDAVETHHHVQARALPEVDPDALEVAASFFRAAADPARLRVLLTLQGGEWCVSELSAAFGEGLSTMSQRLKVLRNEGLVVRRRQGKHLLYSLADEHVTELIANALAHASERSRTTRPRRAR
jgi:DNA-binding transcriptional ArsR family regulator